MFFHKWIGLNWKIFQGVCWNTLHKYKEDVRGLWNQEQGHDFDDVRRGILDRQQARWNGGKLRRSSSLSTDLIDISMNMEDHRSFVFCRRTSEGYNKHPFSLQMCRCPFWFSIHSTRNHFKFLFQLTVHFKAKMVYWYFDLRQLVPEHSQFKKVVVMWLVVTYNLVLSRTAKLAQTWVSLSREFNEIIQGNISIT